MPLTDAEFEQTVRVYKALLPRYRRLCRRLVTILTPVAKRVCTCAIVTAREKKVASFAEKIIRKDYTQPLKQMTDLCGGRVIVHLREEVEAVCQFVRDSFVIEEAEDTFSRLKSTEFGYRSWHYVVRLRDQEYVTQKGPWRPEPDLLDLKAELQIRTIVQHAWADIGHDRIYKGPVRPSEEWTREAARFAAQLETVDDGFERLVGCIDALTPFAGRDVDAKALEEELTRLEAIRKNDSANPLHAQRMCRLFLCLQRWKEAIALVEGFRGAKTAALRTCLGVAYSRDGNRSKGLQVLEAAVREFPANAEAAVRLADALLDAGQLKVALARAETAYDQAPWNPEAVCCLTRAKFATGESAGFLRLMKPVIEKAIHECQSQAALGVNLPWSLYLLGELHMLLGGLGDLGSAHELPALEALCLAVMRTPEPLAWLVDAALENLKHYETAAKSLPALELVRRLLCLARAASFKRPAKLPDELKHLPTKFKTPLEPPVVIVVGGCDPSFQSQMANYRELLFTAFKHYRGAVLSGGTEQGIPGLIGEVAAKYRDVRAIGYLPEVLPRDAAADARYTELHRTPGSQTFSAREPLQNWIDLLATGIAPQQVSVLGINGGKIAALEYRLALMLGAAVGIIRDSGREANVLKREADQRDIPGLSFLPGDAMTLQAFVMHGSPSALDEAVRTELAKNVHADYVSKQSGVLAPALKPWEQLANDLKESNFAQVDDVVRKLEALGLHAVPLPAPQSAQNALHHFSEEQLEKLAEMEHGRYVAERLRAGWKLGARDDAKKQRPSLVSWKDLPEEDKKKDRAAVELIPKLLADAGYVIREGT